MADVVYPVCNHSKWNDNQLRYSLRSLQLHGKNIGNLYIIGHAPDFLIPGTFIHVPFDDSVSFQFRQRNVFQKVFRICAVNGLSQKFLFMNDDFYFNGSFDVDNYLPRFFKTLEYRLAQISTVEPYRYSISNTIRRLNELSRPVINYELHRPCLFDKDIFFDVMLWHDWEIPYGYVLKSLYFNLSGIQGVESFNSKINYPFHTYDELKQGITRSDVFSSGAYSLNDAMKKLIIELFPNPSRWETAIQSTP